MPQPSASSVHVDAVLTNISIAYIQDQNHFVANKVFPTVPVEKKSDKYFTYTKHDWFRDEAQLRADATESAGSGYNISSTATYSCDVYAFHKDVGDQARANADNPLNPDQDAARFVAHRLLMRQEKQFVSDFISTGIWGTDLEGGASGSTAAAVQWSDGSNSDPINDIETAKSTILSNTGFMPNTLLLNYDVFRHLKNHPDIIDRFKYTTANVPMEAQLASVFGIDRVIVSMSVGTTSNEGAASPSYGFNMGKNALVCYVNPSPSLLAPSAGYIFSWNGISGGLGSNVALSRYRMDTKKADRIEGEIAFDNKLVASDLGYYFYTISS